MAGTLAHMLLRAAGRLPVVTRRPAHRFELADAGLAPAVPAEQAGPGFAVTQRPADHAMADAAPWPPKPAAEAVPVVLDPPFEPGVELPPARAPAARGDAGWRNPAAPPQDRAPPAMQAPVLPRAPRQSWPTDAPADDHGAAAHTAHPFVAVRLSRQDSALPDATHAAPAQRGVSSPETDAGSATARPAVPAPAASMLPATAAGHGLFPPLPAVARPSREPLVRPPTRTVPGAAQPGPAAGASAARPVAGPGHGTTAQPPATPTVQVTIGSIEIRAMPATPRTTPMPPAPAAPAGPGTAPLGLADYLARRGRP